ncbi:MAG: hypothetical protein R3D00_00375 [Bacteroidia bacterium]
MKKSILGSLVLITIRTIQIFGQTPIDVAESTLKVGGLGEEVFYYGFAEGDQLIFNFEELNGKELKEIEITELPSSSKFMDYKTNKIENKSINIQRTGIYKFRFSNSAVGGRVCKFKIQRIPASENTVNFNPSVLWRTISDTTYTPVEEKYLVKSDTVVITVVDQVAKISSRNALNGNTNINIVDCVLPERTVSWAFYIGVGTEGKKAYEDAKDKFMNSAAASAMKIPGYGTMAALALYGLNVFSKVQGEDNVKYRFITDWENVLLFKSGNTYYQYKQGDVVNDASQMKSPLTGKIYIGLINDNVMEPIDVIVKITAIQVNQEWDTRIVNKMSVRNREEAYLAN